MLRTRLPMQSDTSPEAAAVQEELFRRMTPGQRLHLALEMSDSIRLIALAGLQKRRPDLTGRQLMLELARLMHGSAAF